MIPVQGTEGSSRCAVCGAKSPSQPPPLSWSFSHEGALRLWTCDGCARANLDKIEMGWAMERW
jgi:hypothetical protein